MNKYYLSFIILICTLLLTACGKEIEHKVESLNISPNALAYFYYYSDKGSIYELSENGTVSPVKIEGNSEADHIISSIHIVNSTRVIFSGGNELPYDIYIADRTTGKAYKAQEGSLNESHSFWVRPKADDNNTIYFVDDENRLFKAEANSFPISAPSSIGVNGETIEQFAVDNEGNVLCRSQADSNNDFLRFYSHEGIVHILPFDYTTWAYIWTGYDNNLYYIYDGINQINNQNGTSTKWYSDFFYMQMGADYAAGSKNTNTIIAGSEKYFHQLSPTVIDKIYASSIGLNKINEASASNDYLYFIGESINGKGAIVKVNPSDYSYEIVESEKYTFENIFVTSDDRLVTIAYNKTESKYSSGSFDFSKGEYSEKSELQSDYVFYESEYMDK